MNLKFRMADDFDFLKKIHEHSREACGVPFSCCKPSPDEVIKNVQCGYDVRKPDYVSFDT